jgi:hypothetical protein
MRSGPPTHILPYPLPLAVDRHLLHLQHLSSGSEDPVACESSARVNVTPGGAQRLVSLRGGGLTFLDGISGRFAHRDATPELQTQSTIAHGTRSSERCSDADARRGEVERWTRD